MFAGEIHKHLSLIKSITAKKFNHAPSSTKPDVAVIVCLLKSIGFHLEKFEKQDGGDINEIPSKNIRITLQCGSSKMQAVLKMDEVDCQCPDPDDHNGSFWSVTGSDNNKIEETGSTLLPHVSKEKNVILQNVCQSLFDIIEDKGVSDANISTSSAYAGTVNNKIKKEEKRGMFRSSTQPEINIADKPSLSNFKPSDEVKKSKPILPVNGTGNDNGSDENKKKSPIRQDTYELEMDVDIADDEPRRILPPSFSKSPTMVPNLCSTLDNFSFGSSNNDLLEYILNSIQSLEKVIQNHMRRPITSSKLSLNADDEHFQSQRLSGFNESYTFPSSKTASRTGSTSSLQNISRSSTTIQKTSLRKNVGVATRAPAVNEKNVSAMKTSVQVRKPTPTKPSTLKTSTDKTRKSIAERSLSTPKRRASDIGVAGSLLPRNTSTSLRPLTTKTPLSKTPTNNNNVTRFGYKK